MKNFIYIAFLGLLLAFPACSDWLDVEPSDRVSEEGAFSTLTGFQKSLNGVYVELNQNALYGSALTSEFVEILAQQYAINEESERDYNLSKYEYHHSDAESRISQIWEKGYNLIANTNLILKNCETKREILPDNYYQIIKGETLALRAMLHFDLFRLFGPVYGKDSLSVSIPYYTEFSLEVASSLSGNIFMQQVIDDLLEAEQLLVNDPIIERGIKGDKVEDFLKDRNLRLNYYAVQALLARVYTYKGDKDKALEYAKKIISIQEKHFPWVDETTISSSLENPDRVFSTEVIFALQNPNRNSIFTQRFDALNLKLESLLAPREDIITNRIFEGNRSDYRYIAFFEAGSVEKSGVNYKAFNKFKASGDSLHAQMIPMLRISEAYLIASEFDETSADRRAHFKVFRTNRGLESVSYLDSYYLDLEWMKEFRGEGQLFFYYKRNMKTAVQSPYSQYENINLDLTNYVLPIPDGETQYN